VSMRLPADVICCQPRRRPPAAGLDNLRRRRATSASRDVQPSPSPWIYWRHCYCVSVSSTDPSHSAASSA